MKISRNVIIHLLLLTAICNFSCEKNSDTTASGNTGSGAGGSLARFAVAGNYLYMVDYSTLRVFDITDPTKPVKKSEVNPGFDIETIFPYKDKLFLGAASGMYIYSIVNPANPVKEGSVSHFRACDPVVSNDTVSYVTLRSFGTNCGNIRSVLNIYNIKKLSDPKLEYTVDLKSPYGLGLKDKALYVCEGINGLLVFDLGTNPYAPVKKKEFKDNDFYYDVIPYGNVLIVYLATGVSFYDITNPLNPVFLSSVKA